MVNQAIIDNTYNKIFSPQFLVKYGYYDVKKAKAKDHENIFESNYSQTDEIFQGIFNMNDLAKYLDSEDLQNKFFSNSPNKLETESISFTIPKTNILRREYKMPNIFSYLDLAFYVSDHKKEFTRIYNDDKHSTSKYFKELDFKSYNVNDEIKQLQLSDGNKRLHSDLSNFYPSLYTHSIPWIIQGKDVSKQNRHSGFANDIDKLVRNCQFGETHGIPTGNLITSMIAELFMCYFDKKLDDYYEQNSNGEGTNYNRYVDDFLYSYFEDQQKTVFLNALRYNCREYDLLINEKKTYFEEYPFSHDLDKDKIFDFLTGIESLNVKDQQKRISSFIDLCEKEENFGNKGSLKCVFSSLEIALNNEFKYNKKIDTYRNVVNKIFTDENELTGFNIYIKILKLSMQDSRLSNRFIKLTNHIIELGADKEKIKKLVKNFFINNQVYYKNKLSMYAKSLYHQEMYQILLYLVVFDVDRYLTKEELIKFFDEGNSIYDDYSLCLVLILYIKSGYEMDEIFTKINNMLCKIDQYYNNAKNYKKNRHVDIMAQKLWLFKYFLYDLIEEKSYKLIIKNYSKSLLNRDFALTKRTKDSSSKSINNFFIQLLNNKIHFVSFGNNNDFVYL